MKRNEPGTLGTKSALLKAVINNAPAKKPEEIEKKIMNVEELMKKYEVLGGESSPEDLRVTVVIDLWICCCLVHQRSQGALGVDHPRDEVQRGPRRDHEFRGKEKGFVRHSAQSHGG